MKHLINITDLSCEKIETLLQLAQDMKNAPEQYQDACAHKILATLFFEPSTRTRLSFESAMLSLGGRVLGFFRRGNHLRRQGGDARRYH